MPSISGTVLNLDSRKAIKGASVYTDSGSFPSWDSAHATTDENGRFEFRDLPPGTYTIRAQTEPIRIGRYAYPFFGAKEGLQLSDDDIACVIEVDVRGVLHGRVKDVTTGLPIRGAAVELDRDTGGLFKTFTSEDGEYSLGHIKPQTYGLTCQSAGFVRYQQYVHIEDALDEGPVILPIFLIPVSEDLLGEHGTVRGFILDETGNPVLGAQVNLVGEQHLRTAITSKAYFDYETGNFEFLGVKPGHYLIDVSKAGMQPIRSEVDVQRGRDNWVQDLRMQALPISVPPELEFLRVEPRRFQAGQQVKITFRIKKRSGNISAASGTIWGPAGRSLGFTFERKADGEFVASFSWSQPGMFVLSQLFIHTETGQGITVPVQAQFEVVSIEPPVLNPDSPIFKVPR